jgi:WD40 repeat protein
LAIAGPDFIVREDLDTKGDRETRIDVEKNFGLSRFTALRMLYSPDGKWLAAIANKQLCVLGPSGIPTRVPLPEGAGSVGSIGLSNTHLIGTGRIWSLSPIDLALSQQEWQFDSSTRYVVSSNRSRLARSTPSSEIEVWDLTRVRPTNLPRVFKTDSTPTTPLAFSDSGKWLLTASTDGTLHLIGADEDQVGVRRLGKVKPFGQFAIDDEGRWLSCFWTRLGKVEVASWDIQGNDLSQKVSLTLENGRVSLSSNGRFVGIHREERNELELVDLRVRDGSQRTRKIACRDFRFSRSSRWLYALKPVDRTSLKGKNLDDYIKKRRAITSQPGFAQLPVWDLSTDPPQLREIGDDFTSSSQIATTPDDSLFVANSVNLGVGLFRFDGHKLQEFHGSGSFPFWAQVAISPDGYQIAAYESNRDAVYLWRRKGDPNTPIKLSVPGGNVRWIDFTPDSRSLIAESESNRVFQWTTDWDDLVALTRKTVGRTLTPAERQKYRVPK